MKIIQKGIFSADWWVNKTHTCTCCKQTVLLEKEDEGSKVKKYTPTLIEYICSVCDTPGVLQFAPNTSPELLTEAPQPVCTEPATSAPQPVDKVTATPAPEPNASNGTAAAVGSKVSYGWSDPFQGTSWGVKK